MGIFEYRGTKREIDLLDVDTLKTFNVMISELADGANRILDNKVLSEEDKYELLLEELDDALESVLGQGIILELFGTERNLRHRFEAVNALLKVKRSLIADTNELTDMIKDVLA